MNILNLVKKDLTQIFRDRKSALMLIVLPILATGLFGLLFSRNAKGDPRLLVGVINRDTQTVLPAQLQSILEASDVIRPVVLTEGGFPQPVEEYLQKQIREGNLAAAIIVPMDFGEKLLAGEEPALLVVYDSNSLSGQAAESAIQGAVTRLFGAVQAARIGQAAMSSQTLNSGESSSSSPSLEAGILQAVEAWRSPRVGVEYQKAGNPSASTTSLSGASSAQASPGFLVLFTIMGLISSGYLLLAERKNGTLRRMLAAPMRRHEIIAGHMLAMVLLTFFQEIVLVVFGQAALGVNYLRDPLAVILLLVAIAVWAASLGLLISVYSASEDQVVILSLAAMVILAFMGGAVFPLDIVGKQFAAIGHIFPSAWAMEGFQNITIRGLGTGSVLLPVGMLGLYAVLFFGLALGRFRFSE